MVKYNKDCEQGEGDEEDQEGWTWANDDKTKVTFCPKSCERLNEGLVEEIKAQFGCKTEVV